MKNKASISYVYTGLFLSSVLIILIGNTYLLIDRTRSNLIEIYWKQGELIVKSIAVSAQQSVGSVTLTPQQIKRHIRRIALKIDPVSSPTTPILKEDLLEFARNYNIDSIEIMDEKGTIQSHVSRKPYSAQKKPSNRLSPLGQTKTLDVKRTKYPGLIRMTIGPEKQLKIKTQIGLQLIIAFLENQNIIQHISFINDQFIIIADSDLSRVGLSEERIEYLDSLKSGISYFFRGNNQDTMEVIHPLNFSKTSRGILKITYPITRIDKIYDNALKNAIINSVLVMLLAVFVAVLFVKWYKRNLREMEAMEKKIREKEKLVSLGNLTAGVAHEVRNPLNSVFITIQRLQLEFTPSNDDDLEEYVFLTDLMKKEVNRINLIITDFLDFAKPFEPKKTNFSIDEFIEENITLFKAETGKKGVNIIRHTNTNNRFFFGDREKLTQVFVNILHNALDATNMGGTITISSNTLKKDQWELLIKDNGKGISKANLNHIFDIYFTTKKSGTGLGLYISRKIVHAHKGNIELSTNTGKGITVKVALPKLVY